VIRALVVDYGEVLSAPPDPAAFAEMARIAGAGLPAFTEAYWRLRPGYDRGELDAPRYWRLVGEASGTEVGEAASGELVERDIRLWSRVDSPMLAWANAVAGRGLPVGLLSNMVAEIGAHLRDTLRLFDRFASVTYSYEVGAAKPDLRVYAHALASLRVAPGDALFVDDRAVNIEAARSVGMHAHRFLGHDGLLAEIDALYTFVPDRARGRESG
jgi:putative hydrolase of the HAD superfamily